MKAGGNCGIGLFYLVSYDILGYRDNNCFTEIGVENLEKAQFKILAIISLLLGGFCAFVALYLLEIIWREGFYSF